MESEAAALASSPVAEALQEDVACLQRRLLEVQIEALQAQAKKDDAEAKYWHLHSAANAHQLCEQEGMARNPRYEGQLSIGRNCDFDARRARNGDSMGRDAAQCCEVGPEWPGKQSC